MRSIQKELSCYSMLRWQVEVTQSVNNLRSKRLILCFGTDARSYDHLFLKSCWAYYCIITYIYNGKLKQWPYKKGVTEIKQYALTPIRPHPPIRSQSNHPRLYGQHAPIQSIKHRKFAFYIYHLTHSVSFISVWWMSVWQLLQTCTCIPLPPWSWTRNRISFSTLTLPTYYRWRPRKAYCINVSFTASCGIVGSELPYEWTTAWWTSEMRWGWALITFASPLVLLFILPL